MIFTVVKYVAFAGVAISGLAWYRSELIQQGYDKAVAEFVEKSEQVVKQNEVKIQEVQEKLKGVTSAYEYKTKEIIAYRRQLDAAAASLRKQAEDNRRAVEEATCGSVRDYASATYGNFIEAKREIEGFGIEAANCSATAETLKAALDLANQ